MFAKKAWKFQDFSVSPILREIDFGLKTAIFALFEGFQINPIYKSRSHKMSENANLESSKEKSWKFHTECETQFITFTDEIGPHQSY